MVIGFTQRTMTVSESDAADGIELFAINISVAIQRTSERDHQMIFRLLSGSTARVESANTQFTASFDATFGIRHLADDPIEWKFTLESLMTTIPPLPVQIRDDFRPEEEECFTLRIPPVDIDRWELFSCNSGGDNYLCETTICIADNDGRFVRKHMNT